MSVALPHKLPRPDRWLNYWLSTCADNNSRVSGPCLLHSVVKTIDKSGTMSYTRWFGSRGVGTGEDDCGILFDGTGCVRYFNTPEEAFRALQEAIC